MRNDEELFRTAFQTPRHQSPVACSTKDLIWLILLVSWLPLKAISKPWQIIEFFCGRGRFSTLAALAGFRVASFGINIGKTHRPKKRSQRRKHFDKRQTMDMNGEIGFSCLVFELLLVSVDCFLFGSFSL